MLIKVTENNVKISEDIVLHKGEYGIHKCQFEFSEEYNNLSKIAVFKSGNEIYKIDIINNECDIPAGALERTGNIIIGLYAYITENDELKLRYSPAADSINVYDGSYSKEGVTPTPITPSQYEAYTEALNKGLSETKSAADYAIGVGEQLLLDKENGVFKGDEGKPGPEGPEGKPGPQGEKGETAITVNVGSVETVGPDTPADVTNSGTDKDLVLNFKIPKGENGYTPIKGKDYFDGKDYSITDSDYQEIANVVENDIKPTLENNLKSAKDYTDNSIIRDIKDISYNEDTATFVFTRHDNTTFTVDLPIEATVADGRYDNNTKELVLVLVSGQEIKIPVSGLIDDYDGLDSATIQCVVSADNKITCNIISGSISKTLLTAELQQEISNKVNSDTFTTELGKKVNTEIFTSELAKKVNTADVGEEQYKITYEDGSTKTIKAVVWK